MLLLLLLSPATRLFSLLILLLNKRRSPQLRLQVAACSTFPIMCDVPGTAVFCTESIERVPGVASKFLLKTFVNIPAASHYYWYNHLLLLLLLLLL